MTAPTYGKLALQGNRWVLSDIPPHVAIRLKNMFPRIPKTQTKVFDLPFTDELCADLSWFESRYKLELTDKDRHALERGRTLFEEDRAASEAILLPDWMPPARHGYRPPFALYDYQSQAVELLHRKKRLLVGDDVGLGKTHVALGALAGSPYLPAAIVVQAHLPSQWVNEFIKPFTYMQAHIVQGTKPYSLPPANLYIFKYSNIAGWADIAATGMFKAVVFDEIQELRNGTGTEKGKAAKVFSDNAVIRCGLSATPIFGYGSEAFRIIEFLESGLLGTWEEFLREWCKSGPGGKWVVKDPDALGTYLRESQIFIRRLRQGRPVNRIPIEVDFDEDVAAKSEDFARQLALKVIGGSFTERGQAARELDALARQTTGLAKAHSVAAYVRILLEAGTPVLLAGWHRSVYDIWLKDLAEFNPILYTGSETARQKDRAKEAFISGKTNLMIISLRSGAGLDGLQKRCSTVVIGELDWAGGAIYEQLLGRVDRPGQKADEITAIFLYTNSGSDPLIMSVTAVKRDQLRGINDPGLGIKPVHSDESHIRKLAQAYLDKRGAKP
ncbi:DEAD/DEAH box helicase [Mesorhizobium sp.]|uniref:SNF2-related protein n=1 Tax=Mesorhizobium sp. TaxID=1871066 RepID=UPI00121ED0AD|nr:DEAD/DEAH box helicase [Mesorhizobium sp.]TIX28836.1 MAG: DEAD/DEAH box helicase [Mesorhizobium sp.]